MLEDVPQQYATTSIDDDIDHLRQRLEVDVSQMKTRSAAAEAAVRAAQAELAEARAAVAKAETRFRKYVAAFSDGPEIEAPVERIEAPEPVVVIQVAQPKASPVPVPTPQPVVKPEVPPSARPSAKRGGAANNTPTVPERVAAVMGDAVWDAGGLEKVLVAAGEDFKSNNLRAYISGILSASKMPVPGGEHLKDSEGNQLKVRRFTNLERGKYRVATAEDIQNELRDIQREVRKTVESNDVVISENASPADEIFAEQGIDISPVTAQQY